MITELTHVTRGGIGWYEDRGLRDDAGIIVAFSERAGGVSVSPRDSLNLAGHVGDDPHAVDENRRRFLKALDPRVSTATLVTAEQVHGTARAWVGREDEGRGAFASGGRAPVGATDALMTDEPNVPLMLLFADCVPVVVVDPVARRLAVVHAGWRGALGGISGLAVEELVSAGSDPGRLLAYVGPHICARHYPVSNELVTGFARRFDTVCEAAPGHLDLGAAVSEDLTASGVRVENMCRLGICTAEATERFFSYRASSGITGRHAALALILE